MDQFIEFVADIFEIDSSEISMDTKYDDLDVWDSLMMMRLIMETEEEYGCVIPIEKAAQITSLMDLYQLINKG